MALRSRADASLDSMMGLEVAECEVTRHMPHPERQEIRLWVDDERPAPPGWQRAHDYFEAIEMLRHHTVLALALDHDLGLHSPTGYDLACRLEAWAFSDRPDHRDRVPPAEFIYSQSANYSGRQRILACVQRIERAQYGARHRF